LELGKEITRALPVDVDKVGVFYDEDAALIEEIADQAGLTAVQLHGDESPAFAKSLFRSRGQRSRTKIRVFKTLHMTRGVESVARQFLRDDCVDGLLLDSVVTDSRTGEVSRGGTGHTFGWKPLADLFPELPDGTRIIVAGGLSPVNVSEAVRVMQPWGVDVCSGVEQEPGKKDHRKVKDFVQAARVARAHGHSLIDSEEIP
jgi:phosphoribosylanthranilate isomerase